MANGRILLVESDLILAWDVAESLDLLGYEVCTARTEAEGVRSAASFHPQMAIVDTDALHFSEAADGVIFQVIAQGPVIFATPSLHWNPAHLVLSSSVDVIRKPFPEAERLAKVADAMDARRMEFRPSEVRRLEVEAFV